MNKQEEKKFDKEFCDYSIFTFENNCEDYTCESVIHTIDKNDVKYISTIKELKEWITKHDKREKEILIEEIIEKVNKEFKKEYEKEYFFRDNSEKERLAGLGFVIENIINKYK